MSCALWNPNSISGLNPLDVFLVVAAKMPPDSAKCEEELVWTVSSCVAPLVLRKQNDFSVIIATIYRMPTVLSRGFTVNMYNNLYMLFVSSFYRQGNRRHGMTSKLVLSLHHWYVVKSGIQTRQQAPEHWTGVGTAVGLCLPASAETGKSWAPQRPPPTQPFRGTTGKWWLSFLSLVISQSSF